MKVVVVVEVMVFAGVNDVLTWPIHVVVVGCGGGGGCTSTTAMD